MRSPIWAPDSRHLLVFGDGKLRKMDVDGGPSQIVCEGGGCGGTSLGSWDAHDVGNYQVTVSAGTVRNSFGIMPRRDAGTISVIRPR